jgi:FtsH-binding integral membrane protein
MYNYDPRNNGPFGGGSNRGRGNQFGSRYQYQTLAYGAQQGSVQAGSLISKVMGMLAFSFIFAALGSFVGFTLSIGSGSSLLILIAGFVVLLVLHAVIQRTPLNLILLYGFTFLEGLALAPLLRLYIGTGNGNLLGQAFVLTALVSLSLGVYSWTTKRDFTRIGDYLFFGVILLLIAGLVGLLFHSTLFSLLISVVGVAIFSGYVLFYVQRAKYMVDTLPNAVGLTVSIFITVLNLFLYILEILTIFSGGRGRR